MKDKKTFGVFIRQKRLDKNYSQSDLAKLLFVTESAISKWERGVTYPDITLIKDICNVLDITEHELIESSNDDQYRQMKRDAEKFNKIRKVNFWIFNICYIAALLSCFIVNLAVNHTLSWFFIVLVSIICAYTFCPTITWLFVKYKRIVFIGSTFFSLFLLFLTCSIYTNNYWFMIATLGVLLGYFIVFYPILFIMQKEYVNSEKYIKISKYFLLTYSSGILILIYLLLIFIYCYERFNLALGLLISGGCLLIPIIFGILNILLISKRIQKIVLYSLIGLLVLFFAFSSIKSINIISSKETNTYTIEESYTNIEIRGKNSNVNFYLSENSEHKIVYAKTKKVSIEIEIINNTLIINQFDNRKFYEKMFVFEKSLNIDLYLPQQSIDSLNIEANTSDINIYEGFAFDNAKIKTSTGDIKMNSIIASELYIENSTGDIIIKDCNIANNAIIGTETGDIEIKNTLCNKLDIKVSTGDSILSNTIVTTDFTFKGSTSDVTFDRFDAHNIYVSVSTGDVTGTILTDKIFNAHSNTGDVIVPKTYTGGSCEIITSTGDIIINYE